MRLRILDHGHRRPVRAFFSVVRRLSGVEMADVPKVLLYRPELFGRPMLDLTAHLMRGEGDWPVAERELIAMRLAEVHQSPFCIDSHAELTRIASDGDLDPFEVPRHELAATLELLRGTAIDRTASAPSAAVVQGAGVADDVLDQALCIALVWNVIDRLANAFGFELRAGQLEKGTKALHRMGYRFPAILTRGGGHPEPRTADRDVLIERLRHSVLDAPGFTPPRSRAAAASNQAPAPWSDYVDKVATSSHTITDDDVEGLKAAGCNEDEIFEMTVAAALGAALASLGAGRSALQRQEDR